MGVRTVAIESILQAYRSGTKDTKGVPILGSRNAHICTRPKPYWNYSGSATYPTPSLESHRSRASDARPTSKPGPYFVNQTHLSVLRPCVIISVN